MTHYLSLYETPAIFGVSFFIPEYVIRLAFATILGLGIGLERALRRKVASLRTFSFICVGSCLFSIISVDAAGGGAQGGYDITRVAAGIVQGIGFIGGGVIFKSQDRIEGITTGAMIWITAALGMACGFNDLPLALWGFIFYVFILMVSYGLHKLIGPPPRSGRILSPRQEEARAQEVLAG